MCQHVEVSAYLPCMEGGHACMTQPGVGMVSLSCPVVCQEFLTCWGWCLKLADTGAEIPQLNGEAVGFQEHFDAACVEVRCDFPVMESHGLDRLLAELVQCRRSS